MRLKLDVGISTSLVMTIILRNFDIIQKEVYRQTTETFCFRNNGF